MYKIDVKSAGTYGNVALGARYTFSKRNAEKSIKLFLDHKCEIEVTKFLKCGGLWTWSEDHNLYGGLNY